VLSYSIHNLFDCCLKKVRYPKMSWESASLHCLYRAIQVLKLVLGLHLIKNPNMGRWENRKVYVVCVQDNFVTSIRCGIVEEEEIPEFETDTSRQNVTNLCAFAMPRFKLN